MELHSCHNCQLIDDVISTKLKNFDILSEENITLHNTLIKTRDSLVLLEAEVVSLNDVIAAERQRNLDLYLKQLNQQNGSNVLMNVILKANAKDAEKHFSYSKKLSFQPCAAPNSIDSVLADKYDSLMNLYEEQKRIYEENLETLQNVNEKYIKKLEEELQKARDHSSAILDMYSFYRKQFFAQKLENARDHKDFLNTADILSKVNRKHILEVERQLVETTTCSVNEQTRGTFNSLMQQIHKRDKLVYMLRRQQRYFDKEVDTLEKQLMEERRNADVINNNLRKQLINEKRKYSALERRRAFDLEGFQTDIQQFRKKLSKLKDSTSRFKLEDEVDSIEKRLTESYLE